MSQKVHPKGFRLRTTPGFTKSKTALGKGITLANTQHETEACLNTPQGGLKAKPLHSAFDSVWFSDPKKGKHSYTRLSHEDQLIQTYTKGFFRSFGFYQQKCVIERKCNKELHITSYVLRTPKLQPSKLDILGTRTRQEKTLQIGLEQGWIPYLIKSTISKILYDKSIKLAALLPNSLNAARKVSSEPSLGGTGAAAGTMPSIPTSTAPSISGVVTLQENSITSVATAAKRFHSFWNYWLLWSTASPGSNKGKSISGESATSWWFHRSWTSVVHFPHWCATAEEIGQASRPAGATYPSDSLWGSFHSKTELNSSRKSSLTAPLRLTYSIQPAQSLTCSSQLIVDYIADKIEQSVSIQQIFNELLRFFETEALCLGPAFGNTTSVEDVSGLNSLPSSTDQSQSSDSQRPKILGFRIICSGRLQMSSFSKPAEKAESIELTRGVLPLNTISANIDFAQTYSTNPYGTCGIKVWVNRG